MSDLSTAARKMQRLFDGLVQKKGLTLARARTLLVLADNKTWNQKDLANALHIEHPSVVRLLDGLEELGFVSRAPVKGDRRAKQITLTSAAEKQIEDLQQLTATVRRQLLEDIRVEDLVITMAVLKQFTGNAEKMQRHLLGDK